MTTSFIEGVKWMTTRLICSTCWAIKLNDFNFTVLAFTCNTCVLWTVFVQTPQTPLCIFSRKVALRLLDSLQWRLTLLDMHCFVLHGIPSQKWILPTSHTSFLAKLVHVVLDRLAVENAHVDSCICDWQNVEATIHVMLPTRLASLLAFHTKSVRLGIGQTLLVCIVDRLGCLAMAALHTNETGMVARLESVDFLITATLQYGHKRMQVLLPRYRNVAMNHSEGLCCDCPMAQKGCILAP